nr:MAG TPA: hypothetical protein [Caudoviricetes sp.]
MSNKTTSETLRPAIGAYLKYEATPLTRQSVAAPKGTQSGTFVDYPLRAGKKLLALTDEKDGMVVVQPHNCVVDLSLVKATDVNNAASTGGNLDGLKADGDAYGIVYQGTPIA